MAENLHAEVFPIPYKIHLPPPVWPTHHEFTHVVPSILQCHTVHRAHVSVEYKRRLPTSQGIANIALSGDRLDSVVYAPHLLKKLREYANPALSPNLNTYQLPHDKSPRPSNADRTKALYRLQYWHGQQSLRVSIPIGDNHGARYQAIRQITDYLDPILQTRYANMNPMDEAVDASCVYPSWGSGHAVANVRTTSNAKERAGLADLLLFTGPQRENQVAAMEAKPWWVYCGEHDELSLADVFGPESYHPTTGKWWWGSAKEPACMIVEELWVHMVKQGVKWAAFTNLQVVIVGIRRSNNEIAISDFMDWTDPNLHETLAGFAFAAIDREVWDDEGMGVNRRDLIGEFCPDAQVQTRRQFIQDDNL
ncbi:hypothetical protein K474DRAFT_1772612 [Panus rudis PR-1116 ss-1]|nr:hypothetical protein K474DRAFT_1772612 [Panus rudis PR-1116 ss-1]